MPKLYSGEKEIIIQSAAWLFAKHTRDAKEIAQRLGIGWRSVHNYAKTETWDNVLTTLKYEGVRNFRVKRAGRKRKEVDETIGAMLSDNLC